MSVNEVSANEALELLGGDAILIDVRQEAEWDAGHAPMATLIPLADVPDRLDDLPKDRLIICACRSGARSSRAASFLQENGFEVANLAGGMIAWFAEGLPLESEHGDAIID
ncbi:MAG: Rhodanese domain protein [Acidimicrobiaceae bacterium]|nr:Rhodanese domain protein [Acidimicrobiaceae bacterium]